MSEINVRLRISFPKSSEDDKLQLVEMNGSIFAIVHSPLESLGPINLECDPWSLVLLAPIKSETHISISAINIICLGEVESKNGHVNIHATHRLVKFADLMRPPVTKKGDHVEFHFGDDPKAYLFHYRLFEEILNNIRHGNPDSFSQAQQQFITSLCSLAYKMEGDEKNLDLHKVMDVWKISPLNI